MILHVNKQSIWSSKIKCDILALANLGDFILYYASHWSYFIGLNMLTLYIAVKVQ